MGIPLQVIDGTTGYLVENSEEWAKKYFICCKIPKKLRKWVKQHVNMSEKIS